MVLPHSFEFMPQTQGKSSSQYNKVISFFTIQDIVLTSKFECHQRRSYLGTLDYCDITLLVIQVFCWMIPNQLIYNVTKELASDLEVLSWMTGGEELKLANIATATTGKYLICLGIP